jgi:hypothetical protein
VITVALIWKLQFKVKLQGPLLVTIQIIMDSNNKVDVKEGRLRALPLRKNLDSGWFALAKVASEKIDHTQECTL